LDYCTLLTRHVRLRALGLICVLITSGATASRIDQRSPNPAVRRGELLQLVEKGPVAVERIAASLDDRDPLVRRCAVLCLSRLGQAAEPALHTALSNTDILVRRNAALSLAGADAKATTSLVRALKDNEPLVRQMAVYSLASLRPRNADIFDLLQAATADPSSLVQEVATHATDHYLDTVATVALPLDGWKFRLDSEQNGEDQRWFTDDFDDSEWDDIGIGKAWGEFGYDSYIGVAWYRRTISVPENPGATSVELRFEGVDESAWVWINGQYAGEHDIGPVGWNQPFQIDVSNLIRWGEDNQITVRAMNTGMAGGIWLPIILRASKLTP
jgi:hypothetical protein